VTSEETVTQYRIEVRGDWAGEIGGWRPVVDGTVNQTDQPAEEASTFATFEEAEAALEDAVLPQSDGEQEFRIVEVEL
jgi:hypothetical protein